jgi:alpha-ketoglutarate-dependent taurine dioxygenase
VTYLCTKADRISGVPGYLSNGAFQRRTTSRHRQLLYGRLNFLDAGGDTIFLNLYRAFETLSPEIQEFMSWLTAVHNITASMPEDFIDKSLTPKQLQRLDDKTPAVEHPMVRTHPEIGRNSLFVHSDFTSHIKDLARHESDAMHRDAL